MVISTRPLVELVPVQPAAMAGRQICQWDKDSCADAGFLKIDLLGLGMLSAVEDCVDQIARRAARRSTSRGSRSTTRTVYAEIQPADTVGDFQIESRAQMQSLLRTRPENLDDLTVQVALVRPGPIQGKAVHPYIEHRQRLREDPSFVPPVDHPLLAEPLRETLGVVVFQDQVLEVAIALAGFSVGEAEGLRRAMSRKRSEEALEAYRERFVAGAVGQGRRRRARGRGLRQARRLLGLRLPEVARGRVRAARLPVGVAAPPLSGRVPLRAPERAADGLLPAGEPRPRRAAARGGGAPARREPERGAVRDRGRGRPGRARVRRRRSAGGRGEGARPSGRGGPFDERARARAAVLDRAGGSRPDRAPAPATRSAGSRRALLWELGLVPRSQSVPGSGGEERQLALPLDPTAETPELPEQTDWERMLADYRTRASRSASIRSSCSARTCPQGVLSSQSWARRRTRARVAVAGMAVARQRPSTANGVVFMLLEDEHGQVNLIVPPPVYERLPGDRARRAAPARARRLRARRPQPERARPTSSRRWRRSPAALRSVRTSSRRSRTRTTSATARIAACRSQNRRAPFRRPARSRSGRLRRRRRSAPAPPGRTPIPGRKTSAGRSTPGRTTSSPGAGTSATRFGTPAARRTPRRRS